ncbi:ATP-binding cassette domain-containing protein [Aureivirga sp. CE67]|uniref:ATP-binding cassette domain-containing protein n=1 Tax=Aureivirga sp. CE67 TaxID=1788983 RepID=UPI0018CBA42F|nr:ATP-binding cassette domain-containing protein [Aureivirga sp. CE67]
MKKLHIENILKSYDHRNILSNIYLGCNTGEIIGILGRNGVGKSTLLKIIFGSINTDNKFIRIDNQTLLKTSEIRKNIKYLPQDSFLPKNTKIKYLISNFCSKSMKNEILNHEFVKPFLNQKAVELSVGERRILETLMVMHTNANFILLDEPFSGVAPLIKEKLKEIILEFSKKGKGFIITDHDYKNVLEIATRVELLKNGKLKSISSTDDLKTHGFLSSVSVNF